MQISGCQLIHKGNYGSLNVCSWMCRRNVLTMVVAMNVIYCVEIICCFTQGR